MDDGNLGGGGGGHPPPLEALWGDLNGGPTEVKSAKTKEDFKSIFDQEAMAGFAEKEKKKRASKKNTKTAANTEAKEEW